MTRRFLLPSSVSRAQKVWFHLLAVLLLCFCSPVLGVATVHAPQDEARALPPGVLVERQLQDGETHVYKIALAAGTYLRLLITPHGDDVRSQLFAPGGSEDLGVVYFPAEMGARFVSLVAESAGDYRLEIRLPDETEDTAHLAKTKQYELKIEEMRPATAQDRLRITAEKIEGEGKSLLFPTNPLEQRRQGIARYEEALALWRQLGERKAELRMLAYLASKHREAGEPQAALPYAGQAIETARALGDRYQEGNLLLTFALIYRSLGENQKALDSFRRAREIFKNLSARYGEAIAVSHIGVTLSLLGDHERALQALNEALPVHSSLGDRQGECAILNAMAVIHRAHGDRQASVALHNRALEIARAEKLTVMEGSALIHLGSIHLDVGDGQKAFAFAEQSLSLWRAVGNPFGEGDALKMIGEAAHLLGDHQKALDSLTAALGMFRLTWERDREAKALHSLAQVNYSLGNFDEARRQIEQALEIQESLRAKVISQQLREAVFTSAQRSFALYIDVLMQLHKLDPAAGHDRAALQANERARARSLLELLSESQSDIRQGVPKNLLELERSLRQQVNAKAATRARLLSNKHTQAQAAAFDKEIDELTTRYRDVEVQIRQSSPRYAALTHSRPLTTAELQRQLDDQTVLLEFALGDKQSWLWAVTRSSIQSYQLPPASRIEPVARRVYERLTARQPRKGESDGQYQARVAAADLEFQVEAASLGDLLLSPVATKLQQEWRGKRLAIVAPGALEYLPFAALPAPKSRESRVESLESKGRVDFRLQTPDSRLPLLLNHEIVNLPSVSALAALRSETAGRKLAEKTVAIIADPVFEPTDARLLAVARKTSGSNLAARVRSGDDSLPSSAGDESQMATASVAVADLTRSVKNFRLINERGGFSRLPFSREEAEAIALLAPKTSVLKATDFEANRATATGGALSQYRILHFATHGLLNGEHPELSGLVLSLVDEGGKPQDGFLRMHEIYTLHLPADLVVLSACQTALGKEVRGEGLVGLTRGFMYAGARRVVASLWQVDDLATAQLMKHFYKGMLRDGLAPAAALRAAQLELLRQPRWSSPFFWAAFTIQGEWK